MAEVRQYDHCRSIKDVSHLSFYTGREDPGPPSEYECLTIDLCLKCLHIVFNKLRLIPGIDEMVVEILERKK
jgi:hypothetical protein